MNIVISNSSQEPIYKQIISQIKNFIITGNLKEGDNLPSIRNLAKELSISVITTKRSYEELEKEGFIETIPGKGSFVATQNKEILQEQKLKIIEENLSEAVAKGKMFGFSLNELKEMLELLYSEI